MPWFNIVLSIFYRSTMVVKNSKFFCIVNFATGTPTYSLQKKAVIVTSTPVSTFIIKVASHYEKLRMFLLHKGSHHMLSSNWHFTKMNGTQRRPKHEESIIPRAEHPASIVLQKSLCYRGFSQVIKAGTEWEMNQLGRAPSKTHCNN